MEIKRSEALALFAALETTGATKWNPKRMATKLGKVDELVTSKTVLEPKEVDATLTAVLKAIAAEEGFTVIDDTAPEDTTTETAAPAPVEEPAPEPKAKKGKSKKTEPAPAEVVPEEPAPVETTKKGKKNKAEAAPAEVAQEEPAPAPVEESKAAPVEPEPEPVQDAAPAKKGKKAKAAPAEEPTPEPAPVEEPAPTKAKKEPKEPAAKIEPVTPGVRDIVTVDFVCGQIIQRHGLAVGVLPVMHTELVNEFGRDVNTKRIGYRLRGAWHAVRGVHEVLYAGKKGKVDLSNAVHVRASMTRPYCAAKIIMQHGLDAGVTPEMGVEVDAMYGTVNQVEAMDCLRWVWHTVRGALGVLKEQTKAARTAKK